MPTTVPRADVFSLKGGVGKTTLSILLAQAQSAEIKKPVLIVDADLTGTCLGDLLEYGIDWHKQTNLAHLICGRPELLIEYLLKPPVYVYRSGRMLTDRTPLRYEGDAVDPLLLFCPSHANSIGGRDLPEVRREVLQALLGHESAGGWVNHVISQVVETTAKLGELGAVVVDHGPGIAALQLATLEQVAGNASPGWRAVVLTSRDAVDLSMTDQFESVSGEWRDKTIWVVNRLDESNTRSAAGGAPDDWRKLIKCDTPRGAWFAEKALPFYEDRQISETYAESRCLASGTANGSAIEVIRAKVFD